MFLKVLLITCVQINFVVNCGDSESGSDESDTTHVGGEYNTIFRTLPSLFEYVMGVIEENPEILEKDDVTAFTQETATKTLVRTEDEDEEEYSESGEEYDFRGSSEFIDSWEQYMSDTIKGVFGLSASEVAEKTLEIESQLERYNDGKD